MTSTLINLQIQIVTYMIVGFILKKTGIIDEHGQSFLSELVLSVLLPVSVFVSFVNNMTLDLISTMFNLLIASIVIEAIIYLGTMFQIPGFSKAQMAVARYGFLVANGGLIGTPVIEGIFGGLGVMYCNVLMIPTRILAYSAGESIFNPSAKKSFKDTLINFALNKVLLAIVIAILLVSLNIKLPAPVFTAFSKIGSSMTPLSLILVGSILAEKFDFTPEYLYKLVIVNVVRLLVIPVLSFALCLIMKFDFTTTAIITLLLGMPCGSTGAIFAKKYKSDTAFASLCVLTTTIISTFSLVALMGMVELILK